MRIDSGPEFVEYWHGVRERTRRAVQRIPASELEWSPSAGRWTIGDLVRHLAGIERDMYAETVAGRPSRYHGHGRELADGTEAVLAYLDRAHSESCAIFAQLTPERMAGKSMTPAGTPITTWKWLRAMVEHEAHHRGQLYMLLALRGVTVQPLYGLTEEEVIDRSAKASRPEGVA
jgi:uncharacterized damage-inducible protein DinB